jgi:peptidoglycan hydrolase-like protein with peptidoglycan-binding domain
MQNLAVMTAVDKRALEVHYMKSRALMNTYTNGWERKFFFGQPDNVPGNTTQKGRSDCSSACREAIRAAAGIYIGSNTHDQICNQANGQIVDETDGFYPDESKLLPGDLLYFKGNKWHKEKVGHVEMYTGKNECYGHGSGTGPKRHNLHDYCHSRANADKRYYKAIRWIPDDGLLPSLRKGDKGYYVTMMQTLLVNHGYPLKTAGIDGDFGTETLTALLNYQTKNGLALSGGICDQATWISLTAKIPDPIDEPVVEINPYPQPKIDKKHMLAYGAGLNDSTDAVRWAQWELVDAGFSCGTSGIDGQFGKKTKEAVLSFQEKAFPDDRSEWDGIVGPNTRDKLVEVKGSKWLEKEE